ncbi:hypothetical protein KJ713_02145 [Patescibacteria group bacterium]|nr:hypothetical protein [Patescibacteria group bacterium]
MRLKKIKKTYKTISANLLDVLSDIFDITDAFIFSSRSTKLFYQRLRENKIARERIYDRLSYLEKVGYIKYKKRTNSISVKFTLKGKIKLLENSADNKKDGKWRMISFDIPQKLNERRDRFRSAIKRIGFRQVQQSLWVCPFIKADQIEEAIDYYKVNHFVAYLIVEKTDIENHLRKMFKDELKSTKK